MKRAAGTVSMVLLWAVGCSSPAPSPDAVAQGQALFSSRDLSPAARNVFSCAVCHDVNPTAAAGAIKTGAPLAGATLRPAFWAGEENDLLAAINACRGQFMLATEPLAAEAPEARALYAFLLDLEPGDPNPASFTMVRTIEDLPRGNASAGAFLYARTCAACHGKPHTGIGWIAPRVPLLPDDTLRAHADYDARSQRLVFIEKIRHGGFLGYGGDMPPFSAERLSDADVADILEALGVLGG